MHEEDPSFLGRGWSFPPVFDNDTGGALMVEAEEDIVQSLRILFQTRAGERVMHPTYGSRLQDLVFEPINAEIQGAIENAVSRAILFFEPRITLESVTADMRDWSEGHLSISIVYRVRATNSRHNTVFPFYINEGTLLSDVPLPRDHPA